MSTEAVRWDVLAVNLETYEVRVIARDKDQRNAEAIVAMAVLRCGLNEEFFTRHFAGKFNDGDDYLASETH
jgi:hypothetical protein